MPVIHQNITASTSRSPVAPTLLYAHQVLQHIISNPKRYVKLFFHHGHVILIFTLLTQ
jgi:hypothetical protein